MPDVKELAKWLEEEVEFLENNQDYVGGWYLLPNGLAATVLWEDGWGDEVRDDAIQSAKNPDWALCAGILVYNPSDTPDGWFMPWDSKTGDIICETTGITPTEDYENLAKWLIQCFNEVKDCEIKPNGEVMDYDAQFEKEAPVEAPKEDEVETSVEVEEESLKEDVKVNVADVDYARDQLRSLHSNNVISDDEYNYIVSHWAELLESCKKEDKKMIKEDKEYSASPYHDVIAKFFDYDSDFEFLDVVASIIGRVDNFEDDEDIWQAIDDELIYTYDQWTVLEHYCTPQDANWEVAFDNLSGDIFGVCATIAEANKMSEEEPEEEN